MIRTGTTLAAILLATLLLAGCQSSYKEAHDLAMEDPEMLYEGAMQAMASGRNEVAEARIRQALEKDGTVGRYWNLLSLVHILKGDYPEARRAAEEALVRDPELTDARNNLGLAQLNLDDPVPAAENFKRVLDDPLFPQKVNPRFNLGVAFLRQGRPQEALAEFYEVRRYKPDFPRLVRLIAEAREAAGDYDKAAANYLEALRVEGSEDDVTLLLGVGRCLQQLGQTELASRYFRRVLQLQPGSGPASEAGERLVEMGYVPNP